MAISAGPFFKFNPSVSFFVNFDPSRDRHAREHLDALWDSLSRGGSALMPLQQYPFSERYGWVQDRYGLSWQVVPTVLFELISDPDPKKSQSVMKAMLQMKKIDIKGLKQAYEQE